jgi:hypothetical protein
MFRIRLVGAAALLVGASLLGAMIVGGANASGSKSTVTSSACSTIGPVAVYSVKFTCGEQSGSDDDVVTGIYRTNINIHNPESQTVNFCTKVVLPDNATPTGISPLVPQSLGADHSLFIDCYTSEAASIASQLAGTVTAPTTEFEGFVVIEVPTSILNPAPLDVEGKYTARSGAESSDSAGDVSSLQVVVFSPKLKTGF